MVVNFKHLLLIAIAIGSVSSNDTPKEQEYDIIIHALPHTHLDAGWIHTIDYYFENHILDIFNTIIPELE
jgi:hypothetical protein